MKNVYLDHAATTPLDPEVLEAMLPYLREQFGNPSSVHSLGRKARSAIEESRNLVARSIGALSSEIVFTGSATEANNTAISAALKGKENVHVITSGTEHEAVIEPCEHFEDCGCQLSILLPRPDGCITAEAVRKELREETALISIMHTNNETGVENEVGAIGQIKGNALFHSDLVQAVGKKPVDVKEFKLDFASMSAHKFYGPKGVGALYINSESIAFDSLIRGGSQEQGRRAGTENVAGIIGLAKALEIAEKNRHEVESHMYEMRAKLIDNIKEKIPRPYRFNSITESGKGAPHIVSFSFPPVEGNPIDGEMLLFSMDMQGIRASGGSACTSGAVESSHVLSSMGVDRETAAATVRLSMGKDTSLEELHYTIEKLAEIIKRMRGNR